MSSNLLGVGLYTIQEASLLTGIPSRLIRRWLMGYLSGKGEDRSYHTPLWHTQLEDEALPGIGFHDLLELRFVHQFREHGVSLQAIRKASQTARELYDNDHPFTCTEFKTDGRSIFVEIQRETGDESLLDIVKNQYAFKNVLKPFLYAGIEFDNGIAKKWYPVQKNKSVVLNPARAFGKPIIEKYGIPTTSIYESYLVEQNKKFVARIFDIDTQSVDKAITFEEGLLAA